MGTSLQLAIAMVFAANLIAQQAPPPTSTPTITMEVTMEVTLEAMGVVVDPDRPWGSFKFGPDFFPACPTPEDLSILIERVFLNTPDQIAEAIILHFSL